MFFQRRHWQFKPITPWGQSGCQEAWDGKSGWQIWMANLDGKSGWQIWMANLDGKSGWQVRVPSPGLGIAGLAVWIAVIIARKLFGKSG
jgi:hypothetical protein